MLGSHSLSHKIPGLFLDLGLVFSRVILILESQYLQSICSNVHKSNNKQQQSNQLHKTTGTYQICTRAVKYKKHKQNTHCIWKANQLSTNALHIKSEEFLRAFNSIFQDFRGPKPFSSTFHATENKDKKAQPTQAVPRWSSATILIGYYRTGNSAIRSADPENPCLEPDME